MKNQYLTDLGDYGKYALLRNLAKQGVKIGVNWYLTPEDPKKPNDGKFKDYFDRDREEWMLDEELFAFLKKIKELSGATVQSVEEYGLIPGAVYYAELLDQTDLSPNDRIENRTTWFMRSMDELEAADLIFADPDNGISYTATLSTKIGEKFILPHEVEAYYQSGKNVVFYCHKGRRSDKAWDKVKTDLEEVLEDAKILTLTYHKGTQRSYIFAVHPKDLEQYEQWLNAFLDEGWKFVYTREDYSTYKNDIWRNGEIQGWDISLLLEKNNTFHHIFYEFDMYYKSFVVLKEIASLNDIVLPNRQFWINVLIESHATHLRNLIHFFSGKDSINDKTVLIDNPKLGISDADEKTKIIDQAISHLTQERVDASLGRTNITIRMSELRNSMFPEICKRIQKYLEILSSYPSVKEEYLSDFLEPKIQKKYNELVGLFGGF